MLKKLDHLTGLRGLAALIVVFHHFACAYLPFAIVGYNPIHTPLDRALYSTPLQVLVSGNFAVCIFFVLSGFVLSFKYFQTGETAPLFAEWAKRYVRLTPLVLGSILLAYVILTFGLNYAPAAAALSGSEWLGTLWPQSVTLGEAVYHGMFGIILGSSDYHIFNNVLWTMKIEMIGSMLLFALLGVLKWVPKRWLLYVVLAAVTWQSYYIAFLGGIILSDLYSSRRSPKVLATPILWALVVTGLVLGSAPSPTADVGTLFSSIQQGPLDPKTVESLTHILGAVMILVALLYSPALKRVFASKPLVYLGKISFSMYVLNVLMIGSVSAFVFAALEPRYGYGVGMLGAGTAYLLAVFLGADIFTRLIDEPSIRLAGRTQHWLAAFKIPSSYVQARRAKKASATNL